MFLLSEKAEWQKEKETFTEMKSKLEEQKHVDAVKIQEFNVSQAFTLTAFRCASHSPTYTLMV